MLRRRRQKPSWLALLAAALLCAATACGNRNNDQPQPSGGSYQAATAAPADGDEAAQGKGSIVSENQASDLIRSTYAEKFDVGKDDLRVRIRDKVAIPGITLFAVVADPKKLGRNAGAYGIVEGDAIYVEAEAMQRVARAWKYGSERTVSAADFAYVMAHLHSSRHQSSTLLSDYDVEVFKEVSYPKQAEAAAVPAELEVDGLPAVRYALTSEARSQPFSVVTAVVHPDYRVELRTEAILPE
ncbi:hypothetical protein [Haliangium ochraceum]|uniref:Lipoprotein n=1 Tax=Haliangium ochraceum (strain DSM 14365 / JCM 11303 / SMP-2) TaxID=502025 RepID=D0LLZ1_HALO1|nr:hypothetical protein [Haliangium ochraceum]ACY15169.1 hypothetical protein Hoch_2637 [Haliangium ochraceum DSM 14365]